MLTMKAVPFAFPDDEEAGKNPLSYCVTNSAAQPFCLKQQLRGVWKVA